MKLTISKGNQQTFLRSDILRILDGLKNAILDRLPYEDKNGYVRFIQEKIIENLGDFLNDIENGCFDEIDEDHEYEDDDEAYDDDE